MKKSKILNPPLLPTFSGNPAEAGLDEAGRGCLAGPVVAAAVILPLDYNHPLLTDSKKLSKKQKETLREEIKKAAIYWAIGEVSHSEIDEINIQNASFLAMHRALSKLPVKPEYLIVDGNRFNDYLQIPYTCIIKGDSKYFSIAAASVLAKTYRDDLMENLGKQFPEYRWQQNAGYPTQKHREAIREFGASSYHRSTFRLLPD